MSNEKTKVNMDPKYIIKLTVTLFVTCVIVAGLLGGVNAITADKIAAINWEKTVEAMKAVVADPDATNFSDALDKTPEMEAAAAPYGTLDSIYEVQVGGQTAGYAIKVVASGSQGNIEMMVGVDADKVINWQTPVAYIGTVAVISFLFPKAGSGLEWMLYSVFGGGLMLGAIFMATDYATSPVTKKGQLIYGIGCGLLTVFIRYFGSYNEGVCYSIMVMNCCTALIDKYTKPVRFGVVKSDKKEGAAK